MKSRDEVLKEIDFLLANWPSAITPAAALALLNGKAAG